MMAYSEDFDWQKYAEYQASIRFEIEHRLENIVKRIRDLHTHNYSEAYECGDGCCWNPKVDECSECMDAYPCETLKILDGK